MSRAILSIAIVVVFVSASVAQHSGGGGGGSSAGSSGGGGGHSSGGGSYSGGGGGGGGHTSGGGSSSGGSHSGGGHSGGSSSASHSSGSATGYGSGSSGGHVPSGGASLHIPLQFGGWDAQGHFVTPGGIAILPPPSPHSQGISGVDERGRSFTLDRNTSRHVDEMIRSGKSVDEIRDFIRTHPTSTNIAHTEKRGFLAALRHPFRGPEPHYSVDLRHRICLSGSCKVCPAGTTAGANGMCSSPRTDFCVSGSYYHSCNVQQYCVSGTYWNYNANSCTALAQQYRWHDCYTFEDPELAAARQSMETLRKQMTEACRQDATSQVCADMNFAYQQAVGRFNAQRNIHNQMYIRCLHGSPFGSFDPIDPMDPQYPSN